ncbi:MAG: carboxypeptidase regulatory-like domain-containing protein [Acidobacteriota bacterium]
MFGSLILLTLLAADLPPAGVAAIEISGRVLDSNAKPAGNATVELTAYSSHAESRLLQLSDKTHPPPLSQTTTDGEGRFRLSAPAIGMYRVTVRVAGAVPAETALLPLLAPVELPPLRMQKNEALRVRVLAADGTPRSGARIAAWPAGPLRVHSDDWGVAPRLAVSDATGWATLPRGAGESLEVAAVGAGLAEVRASRVTSASVDLRSPPGCARTLAVRDGNGAPVAAAFVAADVLVLGLTDDAGTVTVTLPCRTESRLLIETQDGRGARPTLGPATENASAAVEVKLEPADRLSGRVLDAESRAPLAQSFVWSDGDPAGFVRSDAKGTYAISWQPAPDAGTILLRAAATGHLPRAEKVPPRGPSAAGPTFALQPTATLAGRVVDSAGRPVAAAEIRLSEWSPETLFRFRPRPEGLATRSVSGPTGAFRVEVLPRRAYSLSAERPGFAPATITVAEKLLPGAVRTGLELVLTSGSAAFGKVVNERDEPVPGAEVRLVAATPASKLPAYLRPPDEPEPETSEAIVDAGGTFRFEHLRAGTFTLEAKARGFVTHGRDVVIESGREPANLGTITLERGATLTGTVEDARGRALAEVTVAVLPPSPSGIRGDADARSNGDGAKETLTKADGTFALDGLASDTTVDVIARKTGFVPSTLPQVEIPTQPLRITLEPASRLSGHVKTEQGEPIVAAVVSIRPADAALPAGLSGRVTQTDAAGAFVLEDLGAGRADLSAAARDFVSADPMVLEISEGKSLEGVELTLKRGAAIEGSVQLPGGQPASSARVTMRRKWSPDRMLDIEVSGSAQADGDGRYRLEGVPTGPQTVTATQDGYQTAVRDLEVRAGVNHLDLRLAEGFGVTGVVVDERGRALPGVGVTILTSGPGFAREDVSGGDGAFAFRGLAPGTYSLSALKEGYAAAHQDVQLVDRGVDGLELRLQQGGGVITGRILGLAPQTFSQLQITALKQPMTTLDALREGKPDPQGNYRVSGVFPGEWTVTARLPSGRQARKTVTVAEGGAEAHADLQFERGVTLSGHVRRTGQPVPDASVAATGTSGDSSGSTVTDSAGAFRIEGLVAGEHRLAVLVAQSGQRVEQVIALTSDQNLDVDLPVTRVSGEVVDAATGGPLAGVSVVAEPALPGMPGAFHPRTTTDAYGRFELTGLARGNYRLTAQRDGYAPASVPVELSTDDATFNGARLVLERGPGQALRVSASSEHEP